MSTDPAKEVHDGSERVLSTLNADGTRRWLKPKPSPGRFRRWRSRVAILLVIVYNVLPWITINGRPSILIDLPKRQFTFFGTTFLPTDTLPFMLFAASVFVSIFLATALFGRVWCGWGCPQTVYMEFIYRPIERFFERRSRKSGGPTNTTAGIWTVLKYLTFAIVSLHLAHTFLAYFVGVENLLEWTRRSPFEHPTAFFIVFAVFVAMMFDFCFFREQLCIVACPYGRFQSVMLDRQSMIVGYDEKRGEPRGRKKRARKKMAGAPAPEAGDVSLPQAGDCIDCHKCVTTCPTGIDIREGLQMECIGCAQCIDACDDVMEKIGRPKGLIRYSSQQAIETGEQRLMRPRVIIYPAILLVLLTSFAFVLAGRRPVDISVLRAGGQPYVTLDDGRIATDLRIKIVNRSAIDRVFSISLEGIDGARTQGEDSDIALPAGATAEPIMSIETPRAAFTSGQASIRILFTDDQGYEQSVRQRLQGPWGNASATAPLAGEGS